MRLDKLFIALEADDVSDSAQKEQENTIGSTSNKNNEETDLTNTTDILGTGNNDNSSENIDDEDAENENDSNVDTSDEINDDEEDSSSEEDDINDTDDSENGDNELEIRRKEVLRNNMAYLYDVINNNISALGDGTIQADTKDEIASLDRIVGNLSDCAEVLYNTITKGYKDSKYEDALNIYISSKKLYDISIKMLYNHFDMAEKIHSDKK